MVMRAIAVLVLVAGTAGASPLTDLGKRERAEAEIALAKLGSPLPLDQGDGLIAAAGPCVRPNRAQLQRIARRWLEHHRVEARSEDDRVDVRVGCEDARGVVVDVLLEGQHKALSAILRIRGDAVVELACVVGTGPMDLMEFATERRVYIGWLLDIDGDGRPDPIACATEHDVGGRHTFQRWFIAGRDPVEDAYATSAYDVALVAIDGAPMLRFEEDLEEDRAPTFVALAAPHALLPVRAVDERAAALVSRVRAAAVVADPPDPLDADGRWAIDLALEQLGVTDAQRRALNGVAPTQGSAAAIRRIGEGFLSSSPWTGPRVDEVWQLPFAGACPQLPNARARVTPDVRAWTHARAVTIRVGCRDAEPFVLAEWLAGEHRRQALVRWRPGHVTPLLRTEMTSGDDDSVPTHWIDVLAADGNGDGRADAFVVEHKTGMPDRMLFIDAATGAQTAERGESVALRLRSDAVVAAGVHALYEYHGGWRRGPLPVDEKGAAAERLAGFSDALFVARDHDLLDRIVADPKILGVPDDRARALVGVRPATAK
jgi:hypothetical protein